MKMDITLDQIKGLNSREAKQMRRYTRRVLRRISERNRRTRNQYEQEQDFERKTGCRI